MTTFKVACVQTNSGNNMDANIVRASELVCEAVEHGAEFVAMPENVALMADGRDDLLEKSFMEDEHPALKAFIELANERSVWLLVGSIATKIVGTDLLVNRSYMINPEGAVVNRYDKIHLFDVDIPGGERHKESDSYKAGEEAVVAELPWCRLGMSICYDIRFPQLYRSLVKEGGAEILSVPSAFTKATGELHWHVLLRARAIEEESFVIAPAQTGEHRGGRHTFGHSLIISPQGEIISDAGEGEGIIVADIDLELVKQMRIGLPSTGHDRPFNFRQS